MADDTKTQVPGIADDATEWTIPLSPPVEWGGEKYTSMVLREPTGAEWAKFDKLDGVEAQFMALAIVSGIPEPAVRQIGTRTIVRAGKFLDRFFA